MSAVLPRRLLDAGPIFRRFILGSANFRNQCALGLRDPQSEVSVWLEGSGKPLEVTENNVMVAARPLTIGVQFGQEHDWAEISRRRPVLRFRTMAEGRPLGDIRLRLIDTIPLGNEHLCLFETLGSRNYCVPRVRLWIRHLDEACRRWRSERHSEKPGFQMRLAELRSVFVFYICPRPVVLVSVMHGQVRNIFPMDLIGPVGSRHFTLSLHNSSAPLRLMEQSRRIALSSVPIDQSSVAFELGKNHNASDVDFCSLPFTTTASTVFRLPVPLFALRVREMRIETIRKFESHTLFIASTVTDEFLAEGEQLFQVHGSYQALRGKQGLSNATRS